MARQDAGERRTFNICAYNSSVASGVTEALRVTTRDSASRVCEVIAESRGTLNSEPGENRDTDVLSVEKGLCKTGIGNVGGSSS